ncbi:MAG: acyl transferase [Patiriisocius sp.]|uniref:LuxE/PaaK family acyltransferase n=1 Tax=Patiriisocius sp. TaxID=2822396 RepID=UPI003EF7D74D
MPIPSIFEIKTQNDFEAAALETFRHQYKTIEVYRRFCNHLNINSAAVKKVSEIPFLPIEFFKSDRLISEENNSEKIFTSSGTTGSITSKHYIASLALYEESFIKGFERMYGDIEDYTILALLPSYLEREGSSLVYMVDALIKKSKQQKSDFYLKNLKDLANALLEQEKHGKKTILLGVSYALLDLIEMQQFNLKHTIVMETGGMKGRRKEMIKEELHKVLTIGFGVSKIHSEYGMTELLSQAYSSGKGLFNCPPWMQILTRDTEDPLTLIEGKTGGINVIDLANFHSCSFIATQDLGKKFADGSFEILGRFDASDIRGCNLMVL